MRLAKNIRKIPIY
jgi:hypothetical protein